MQDKPEKIVANYNELGHAPLLYGYGVPANTRGNQEDPNCYLQPYWVERLAHAKRLIAEKIDDIFGATNHSLDMGSITFPRLVIRETDREHPETAGYFRAFDNEVTLVLGAIRNVKRNHEKVLVHELLHFLSHNGRDEGETISSAKPLEQRNNVGFRRNGGLDIRRGKVGTRTGDYFLSFNEAVTEQLAMEIVPGVDETYSEYRGLLNQVIDDAVTRRVGSKGSYGTFCPWSRNKVKNYIYQCYFRGDLAGFTNLLQTIYDGAGLTEQQFGLMTNRDDLPPVVARELGNSPKPPSPGPAEVRAIIQVRLNHKKPSDYTTDVIGPDPGDGGRPDTGGYGAQYDEIIKNQGVIPMAREFIDGQEFEIDNAGFIIYRGDEAAQLLNEAKRCLDGLLLRLVQGEIPLTSLTEQIDTLLFTTYGMSMLSDGFRDFYINKHIALERAKSPDIKA